MNNLQSNLRQHLNPDESLLWTGKPKEGIIFRRMDIFFIPFSILWCSFAIFWVIGASSASLLFGMFGIPFVLIGLFMVFGRFIIDAKQRKNTSYGITENRILIKFGIYQKSIKSVNIKTLSEIEYTEKEDGTGTILLGPKTPYSYYGNSFNWFPGVPIMPQFETIPNVKKVYNQIIQLQNKD